MSRKLRPSQTLIAILISMLLMTTGLLVGSSVAGAREHGSMGDVEVGRLGDGEMGSGGALRLRSGQAEEHPRTSAPQHPSSVAQPRTIAYTYDDAGRLIGVDYGRGKTIRYTYDNAGNLLQRCTLTADFNPDSNVDIAEIMEMTRRWGAGTGEPLYDPAFDLDGNGTIDVVDIQRAAGQWRLC